MNERQAGGGIGLGGALLVLFVALKLAGIIEWSWWWVLSPAWISLGLLAVVLVFGSIAFLIISGVQAREDEARRRARRGVPAPHEHGPARRWGGRG